MKWFIVIALGLALAAFQFWLCGKKIYWAIKASPAGFLLLALPFLLLWNIFTMGSPRVMLTALWLLIGCVVLLAADAAAWLVYGGLRLWHILKNKFSL